MSSVVYFIFICITSEIRVSFSPSASYHTIFYDSYVETGGARIRSTKKILSGIYEVASTFHIVLTIPSHIYSQKIKAGMHSLQS